MPIAQFDGLSEALTDIALNETCSSVIRCEALLALSTTSAIDPNRFLSLLENKDADVAVETARTFRAWLDSGLADDCAKAIVSMRLSDEIKEPLSSSIQKKLYGNLVESDRPQTNEQWRETLDAGGDPGRGRRVFFTARVSCTKCHTVDGRGGILGPDLSRVAASKSRRQMIDSILEPSAEFPPEYQAWLVVTVDGRIHRGLQLDHRLHGAIVLTTEDGEQRRFEGDEIDEYVASPSSLMPSGLSEMMSVSEFKDLIAFLESLK